jgi:hypothetical protein
MVRMVDFMEGEIIATPATVVHLRECFKGRIGKNMAKYWHYKQNRRSFDYASRDQAARDSAQDDNCYISSSLKFKLYRYTMIVGHSAALQGTIDI